MKKRLFFLGCLVSLLIAFFSATSCQMEAPLTKETVTITYKTDHGQLPFEIVRTVEKGYELKAEDLPEIQAVGYKFKGWYTSDQFKFQVGNAIDVDTTLYGQWNVLSNVSNITVTELDKSVKFSWTTPTIDSFEKVEISYTDDKGEKQVKSTTNSFIVIDNLTNGNTYAFVIKALYKNNGTSIETKVNGTPKKQDLYITLSATPTTETYGVVKITVEVTPSDNVETIKWAEGKKEVNYFNNAGTDITSSKEFSVSKNNTYTVFAKSAQNITALNTIEITNIAIAKNVKITYVSDYDKEHVPEDKTVTTPYTLKDIDLPNLSSAGRKFEGWYIDENNKASLQTKVIDNITLTAHWSVDDTDKTPPAEVTGIKVTNMDSKVFIEWTNPADKDFENVIVSYVRDGAVQEFPVKNNYFEINGLTNEASYSFIVKTKDCNGNISNGVPVDGKPTSTPTTPIILKVNYPKEIVYANELVLKVEVFSSSKISEILVQEGEFGGLRNITKDKEYIVNNNGTYTVIVRDVNRNEVKQVLDIQNLDKTVAIIKTISLNKPSYIYNEDSGDIIATITGENFKYLKYRGEKLEVYVSGTNASFEPTIIDYDNNTATVTFNLSNYVRENDLLYLTGKDITINARIKGTYQEKSTNCKIYKGLVITSIPTLSKNSFNLGSTTSDETTLVFNINCENFENSQRKISVKLFDENNKVYDTPIVLNVFNKEVKATITLPTKAGIFTPKIYFYDIEQNTYVEFGEHVASFNNPAFTMRGKLEIDKSTLYPFFDVNLEDFNVQIGGTTNADDVFHGKRVDVRAASQGGIIQGNANSYIQFDEKGQYKEYQTYSSEPKLVGEGKYKIDNKYIYMQYTKKNIHDDLSHKEILCTKEEATKIFSDLMVKANNNSSGESYYKDILNKINYFADGNETLKNKLLTYYAEDQATSDFSARRYNYELVNNGKYKIWMELNDFEDASKDLFILQYNSPSDVNAENATMGEQVILNPFVKFTGNKIPCINKATGKTFDIEFKISGHSPNKVIETYIPQMGYAKWDSKSKCSLTIFDTAYDPTSKLEQYKSIQLNIAKSEPSLFMYEGIMGGSSKDQFKGLTYYGPSKKYRIEFSQNGNCYYSELNESTNTYIPMREYEYKYTEKKFFLLETKSPNALDNSDTSKYGSLKTYEEIYNFFMTNESIKSKGYSELRKNGIAENDIPIEYELMVLKQLSEVLYRQSDVYKLSYKESNGNITLTSECPNLHNVADLFEHSDFGYFSPKEIPDSKDNLVFSKTSYITTSDNQVLVFADIDAIKYIYSQGNISMRLFNKDSHGNPIGEATIVNGNYSIKNNNMYGPDNSDDTPSNNKTIISLKMKGTTFDFNYVPVTFTLTATK